MYRIKQNISILIAFFIIISLSSVQFTSAKPSNKKVKKAYLTYLQNHADSLDLLDGYENEIEYYDVNKDGIKELFYCNGGGSIDVALTYYKGKVKKLSTQMTHISHDKINNKTYLVEADHYGIWYIFYNIKKGKKIQRFSVWENRETGKFYYQSAKKGSKAKTISEKAYKKYTNIL